MAVTACVAQGVTCVTVAKVRDVETPVLSNWASIMGLVMGVLYWVIEDRTSGLSLGDETPLNWALITGEDDEGDAMTGELLLTIVSRIVGVWSGGVHDPDPVPAAGLAQHGVQSALPGDGGGLPGAERHHPPGAQHPLQHRGRPHHNRHHHPRGRGEDSHKH